MVTLIDEKNVRDVHSRKFITNGDKILKKYRKAAIKKAEYRKLKAIVPSVANQKTVSKLTVIEEAIKYIDQLHSALVRKVLTSDPNNNNNDDDDDDDDTDCEAKTVLHNLQRSCESKALPFSSADDFIRNFILQQQQQIFPQHSSLLQQRSNNIEAKNSTSTANKANSLFPQNAGRVAHPVMPMSQRNATLTTETVLSSTSSTMLPKVSTISRRPLANVTVSRSDFVVNKIGNNSNSHTSAFRAKRILF